MDNILLSAKNVSKSYGGLNVINDVDITLFREESVGLVGESGCGKSTLSRLLTGLEKPDSGSILLDGEPVGKKWVSKGRCRANVVFQNPLNSFDGKMTIGKCLAEAMHYTNSYPRAETDRRIKQALEMVELDTSYAERYASQLSGGECQRAAIARAILTRPQLFVCDEITSALDVFVQSQLLELLRKLKCQLHCTYLFISHDLTLVASTCERVYVMYCGTIVEQGAVSDIIKNPLHPYTKRLLSCAEFFSIPERGKKEKAGDLDTVCCMQEKRPRGCRFAPSCPRKTQRCENEVPRLRHTGERQVACHYVP